MKLTERARKIQPSITLALAAQATAMRAEGRDIINMAFGEPDCPAPARIRNAAIQEIESRDVRYTAASGTIELKRAVAKHLIDTRGVACGTDEVVFATVRSMPSRRPS